MTRSQTSHPRLARVLSIPLALTAGAGLFLGLQSFSPPTDGGLSLTTTPGPIPPGDKGMICVTGNPGDWVLMMTSRELGSSSLPFFGGIPIDLGMGNRFHMFFKILTDGTAKIGCAIDCSQPELLGTPVYSQAVSFNPETREVCVSNVGMLIWDGNCDVGCTPGYWKQPHHFDKWTMPYDPSDPFGMVFDDAFPGQSLLDVLGGEGGGLIALGRHAVAALLNAASSEVDYPLGVQDVIDAFNAAYASGDYETQKNIFQDYNENDCPLD